MTDTLTPVALSHIVDTEAVRRYKVPQTRNLFKTQTPHLGAGNAAERAEEIREYFHSTFEVFERVFDCLAGAEAFTVPPVHKLRHPLIFYYGHTACFYINKLVVAGLTERINPKFEEMFAIGVDEMSWDDLNEAHYSWPAVEEVSEYRRQVRDRIDALITSGKFELTLPLQFKDSACNDNNAFWWIVTMGCEHERIHLETASVHVRELPMKYVKEEMSAFWKRCPKQSNTAPENELVGVDGGSVVLGRPKDSPIYGWDCDYSEGDVVKVNPFKASKFLVSNAEYYHFMKEGGYKERKYWDEEGWGWVQFRKPEHPYFWVRDEASEWGYKLRLQTEEIDIPWNWPVEVNHLEASAFLKFKSEKLGKKVRLPTESEWLLLRDRFVREDQNEWKKAPGNVNLEHFASSCPVDMFAQGPLYDIVGNVWQHTANPMYPYSGYRVQPYYDDFSLPTFDGRHMSMKGGAWISTGNEASRDARFAFRRHFYQFIGIRYIEPMSDDEVEREPFKAVNVGLDPEVEATTHFAFAKSVCGVPNVNTQIAEIALSAFRTHASADVASSAQRALDLYCGAGRITFELTSVFNEVVGSDFTARKLMPAFAMKERGDTSYVARTLPVDGAPTERTIVEAKSYPWATTYERATFFQADPSNMHAHMTNFDLIVAFNVLENTHSPHLVPAHLMSRLNVGGVLVIGSSFVWGEVCNVDVANSPLYAADADHLQVLRDLLVADGAAEEVSTDASSVVAAFPDSLSTGTLRTVKVTAFKKLK